MAFAKQFEKLEIWQPARALITIVYGDFVWCLDLAKGLAALTRHFRMPAAP
jgi:hypothetical protein